MSRSKIHFGPEHRRDVLESSRIAVGGGKVEERRRGVLYQKARLLMEGQASYGQGTTTVVPLRPVMGRERQLRGN